MGYRDLTIFSKAHKLALEARIMQQATDKASTSISCHWF